MIVAVSSCDFAELFLARHSHLSDFVDAEETNAQSELLRAHSLDALNAKVLGSPWPRVLDVIAEHNMAAVLVLRGFTELQHEPPSMSRPVDLVGVYAGRSYRIEVKRLAASEHDDLHSTVMHTANKALESNTEKILIHMQLRASFEAAHINALVRHVKKTLGKRGLNETIAFAPDQEVVASYTFHSDKDAGHPHVGILGDMGELREVTGDTERRVRGKVRQAYAKFKVCPEDQAVHLVVLEVDNFIRPSDIADALYGRECATFTREGYAGSGRDRGGTFSQGRHSRLGGLAIARRVTGRRLFGPYTLTLCGNPGGSLPLPDVAEALGIERVVGANDFL